MNTFTIAFGDEMPHLHLLAGGDFDALTSAASRIIYESGDTVLLYYWDESWKTKAPALVDDQGAGEEILVRVEFVPADFSGPGEFKAYLRNETKKISFPTDDYIDLKVIKKGH